MINDVIANIQIGLNMQNNWTEISYFVVESEVTSSMISFIIQQIKIQESHFSQQLNDLKLQFEGVCVKLCCSNSNDVAYKYSNYNC